MSLDFSPFKNAVAKQFDRLTKHDMFRTGAEKDALWDTYLGSFPPGTNPMHRVRTEHDCACCRSFVRAVGNAVAVIDGKIETIWDIEVSEPAYQAVADAMAALVKSKAIENVFLHTEKQAGTDRSHEHDNGVIRTWDHFYVRIPFASNSGRNFYCRGVDIGPTLSEKRAQHDVLLRSLTELTMDAVDTVLELIGQNSLYRGSEQKFAVDSFRTLKKAFDKLSADRRDAFVWTSIGTLPGSVCKIRNSAVGTLLVNLSEGMDLEQAVDKFEVMMDARNYKRPTALVSQKMVDNAKAKIDALGLTGALQRRYARLSDISVNDILFRDKPATKTMKGADPFEGIATKASAVPKSLSKVEAVPVETFIRDIVPNASSIEVMLENAHVNNLVSLIAPKDSTVTARLFGWDNNFSWSYNGDVADSIKERVKKAGGNVSGDLCCRLAWHNYDDLDFHMKEPGRYEIYFGNRDRRSPAGGMLDVDMNAGSGMTREPVENIFYASRRTMREGTYTLFVHNYMKRESKDVGFEVEMDFQGDVHRFAYEKAVRDGERIVVAEFEYTHADGIKMIRSLPSSMAKRTMWGMETQEFHKVNVLMRSPNHWGDHGTGNRHYFFMLDGCVNDGQARGFFNEFLRPELNEHRKVIEIVGSKMKTEESDEQLSGIGFSDTKRNELLVRVKGNFDRTIKVMI